MNNSKDSNYITFSEFKQYLGPLIKRVEKLEEEVFPDNGNGPGGIINRLSRLERVIIQLRNKINSVDKKHDLKTDEVIRKLAKLQSDVQGLQNLQGGVALQQEA